MNKTIKTILIIAIILIVCGIGIGIYMFNKPARNIASEKSDFTVEAPAFFTEFSADENAANLKYLDKVIEVSGTVALINPTQNNSISVVLENEMQGVTCVVDSSFYNANKQKFTSLSPGSKITFKGKCDGLDMLQGVMLTKCVLTEK